MLTHILMDAGWTLMFPDYDVLGDVAVQHGYDIPQVAWERAGAEFVKRYDDLVQGGPGGWDFCEFLAWILLRVGVRPKDSSAMISELQARDAQVSLWAYVHPWLHPALQRLRQQGYQLSVISNADGRVAEGLARLGLAQYFDQVFDSAVVGFSKPDVRLFEHALCGLAVSPEQCLYVGDMYSVDVLGANRAGIAAVHLDPYELYRGWPGIRLPSVAELPSFLASNPDLHDPAFFPLTGH